MALAFWRVATISVLQVHLPDNSLAGHVDTQDAGNQHTCIVVQSCEAPRVLRLEIKFRPQRPHVWRESQ